MGNYLYSAGDINAAIPPGKDTKPLPDTGIDINISMIMLPAENLIGENLPVENLPVENLTSNSSRGQPSPREKIRSIEIKPSTDSTGGMSAVKSKSWRRRQRRKIICKQSKNIH